MTSRVRPLFARAAWYQPRPGLLVTLLVLPLLNSCSSFDNRIIEREFPREDPEEALIIDRDASVPESADAGVFGDAHAVVGIAPNHGPFDGGQTVIVRGNGFASDVRLWFGTEPAEDVVAVDPNRIQATTPPGRPGPTDVVVQNGDDESTRRVLKEGYEYDAFVVEPNAGPTTGGSLITLTAAEQSWDEDTRVTIDLEPCSVEEVKQNSAGSWQLTCRTPPGTPGKKVVTVETGEDQATSVAGAFAYSDYASEYEGGLSGDALEEQLEVRVLNSLTGAPLPGASVILGSRFDERRFKLTDGSGSALFQNAELGDTPLGAAAGPTDVAGEETVTVGMNCMHPLTIVGVGVERVTVFLEPILTPDCIPPEFDTPLFGGGAGGAREYSVTGELAWGEGLEFRPGTWTNVPAPASELEEQVAYVFELSSSPGASFSLPSRLDAVTHDDRGNFGYTFRYDTRSLGNITIYALAGVEDTSVVPRKFTPYAMGLLRGIDPASEPSGLLMDMKIPLDHALALDVEPPLPTSEGPDRADIEVGLRMGASGYVRLPNLSRRELLPRSSPIEFIGLPALAGGLERAEYTASVTAVSGPASGYPRSHINLLTTRATDTPVLVGDFVPVPLIVSPKANGQWDDGALSLEFKAGGGFDLLRSDILIPSQAMTWMIIAPGNRRTVSLPALADYGLPLASGKATVGVAAARISNFAFSSLKERNFSQRSWSAYATNTVSVVLP